MKITPTFAVSQSGMGLAGLRREMKRIAGNAAKVGVLRSTNARDNSNLAEGSTGKDAGNAEVGLQNEFGSATAYVAISAFTGKAIKGQGVPERAFLRVPLTDHMQDKEAMIGQGVMSVLAGNIGPEGAAEVLGLAGEKTVHEAFATGGFGVWPKNTEQTAAWKGGNQPLIDSGQLEDSITSEVVKT